MIKQEIEKLKIDIEDAMEAYWLTAKKGFIGEIYNIGGKTPITVGKYLNELIKLSKIKNFGIVSWSNTRFQGYCDAIDR